MPWVQPAHTKGAVNRASEVLVDPDAYIVDWEQALAIVNNWRAAHGFPLNTFQKTLRLKAKQVDPTSDVVQRLKRLRSIEAKLRRLPGKLSAMQDIGGCRAVVADVAAVDQLWDLYKSMRQNHELVRHKDYLRKPKVDGYRSLHLVYRYETRNKTMLKAWDTLLIEIQVRTRLQHAWATAVETYDTFTGDGIKAGGGREDWRRFFALMSSYLASVEGLPAVPGTPVLLGETCDELHELESRLDARNKLRIYGLMTGWAKPAEVLAEGKAFWYILNRNLEGTFILSYKKSEYAEAAEEYARLEAETSQEPTSDVVLVSADSLAALRRAYPNYYRDTTEFVKLVSEAVDRD